MTITATERIARFIEALSILLLGGGLLCIFIEFKIPGFGVFGIMGIALLALFFWGHHIAGLSGSFELFLFVVGAMLLALEIFVIPGFGAAGISGITLILLALLMSMVEHYPGTHWFKPPEYQLQTAFRNMGLALAIAFGLGLILSRILPKTPGFSHLILASSLKNDENAEVSENTQPKASTSPGVKGEAVTKLHPAGLGMFDGKRVNVIARGSFIDKGTSIVIAEKHGNRIVVDVMRDTETTES